MFGSGKKQHPLSDRRLAGIDVRDDANVSQVLKFPGHVCRDVVLRDMNCCGVKNNPARVRTQQYRVRTQAEMIVVSVVTEFGWGRCFPVGIPGHSRRHRTHWIWHVPDT